MSDLTQALIAEIEAAPEALQQEVLDFLVFLKARATARHEGTENLLPLAQSSWAADWDTPQEDDAGRLGLLGDVSFFASSGSNAARNTRL